MSESGRVIRERVCKLCQHHWFPRTTERPRICPNCKSARWDIGRRVAKRDQPTDPQARALVPA